MRTWLVSVALTGLLSITPALAQEVEREANDGNVAGWAGTIANISNSTAPTFDALTYERSYTAWQTYQTIALRGGWPRLPDVKLAPGVVDPAVVTLRQRLAAEGDLPRGETTSPEYDARLTTAVKRFQQRHGLSETGAIGPLTRRELNTPVEARIEQLRASLIRLTQSTFVFSNRYVIVNIPGAYVEAIANGRVEKRNAAVVGRPDRASPQLETVIRAANFNPTWTAPLSILRKDIMPKVYQNPGYLAEMGMRVLQGNVEVSPASVNWNPAVAPNFTVRQDPGPKNALGEMRFDMPNKHAVYLHDTPKRELFAGDVRFHSSGCVRVVDVRGFADWLLKETPGWSRARVDETIQSGQRADVKLARPVPVAWIYLTGWATGDGQVHFRRDIYNLDGSDAPPANSNVIATNTRAVRGNAAGTADAAPTVKQVAYMDEQ